MKRITTPAVVPPTAHQNHFCLVSGIFAGTAATRGEDLTDLRRVPGAVSARPINSTVSPVNFPQAGLSSSPETASSVSAAAGRGRGTGRDDGGRVTATLTSGRAPG